MKTKANIFFVPFFLIYFFSQQIIAQCSLTDFTVQKTNTTCSANGTIKVSIPATKECTAWVAELVKQGGGISTINIPQTGGDIEFASLGVGNYNLRLTNGKTSIDYRSNPINIATNYVDMRYVFTNSAPSCPNSLDATVTATIASGTGKGPFVFKLVSPTQGTFVSLPQTSRTYTFSGLRGGQKVDLSITDQIDSRTGCEITVNRPSYDIANQTYGGLTFNGDVRAINFYKNCSTSPCSVDMVVNLKNIYGDRLAKLRENPMNAKVTIAGKDYPLTFVSSNASIGIAQFKYSPTITGDPVLYNGTNVQVSFVDHCGLVTASRTVSMPEDNFSALYYLGSSDTNTCATTYTLRIENFFDDGNYRSISFCPQNKLSIKRLTATNPDYYTDVPLNEISPDPNRPNPLNVGQTVNNSIAWGRAEYYLTQPGKYQIIASDECHTITKYITINPINSVLDNAKVIEQPSVLQGSSAISIAFGTVPFKSPLQIKVRRKDGLSQVSYTANGPFQLKGLRKINFPIEKEYIFTDNIARTFTISDLPLGEYIVEITSVGCSNPTTVTRNVTLSKSAEYALFDGNLATNDSAVKLELGCLGASKINFDMGKNGNVVTQGSTELWTATPQGLPLNYIGTVGGSVGGTTTLKGTFSNLTPGNYVVRVLNIYNGYSPAAESVGNTATGPWQYSVPVTVPSFLPIRVEASTIFCDKTILNSGIVNVEITSGTVTYPLTFTLYDVANPTVPLKVLNDPSFETNATRTVTFSGLPQGKYFVRTSTPCYIVDTNVDVTTAFTVPVAKTTNPVICAGSSATLSIYTTKNLYTVFWTLKGSSEIIGHGPNCIVNPTETSTYTAHYKAVKEFNCTDIEYTSDVTVNVLPVDLSIDVFPSQIELCDTKLTTIPITVKNSTTGINYEMVDTDGKSFTPPLLQSGLNGQDLVFNVPISGLSSGRNLKVRPTSANPLATCTAFLAKQIEIISSPKRADLEVIGSSVCANVPGTITIVSSEKGVEYEVLRDDASLSPVVKATGTGANLSIRVPASQLLNDSNVFSIRASSKGCSPIVLQKTAKIIKQISPKANAGADFMITCAVNPFGKEIGMPEESGKTYSWSATSVLKSLSSSVIANPIANPKETTEYTLKVTDNLTGCFATDKVKVTVNLGSPSIEAGEGFTKNCLVNTNGKTIGTNAVNGVAYQWSTASNPNLGTTSTLVANPSITTNYVLTAKYQNGCTTSDSVLVNVDTATPKPIIESIQQPNCKENIGIIKVLPSTTGTEWYSLDNGNFQTEPIFNSVSIGNHTLRAKGKNGCLSETVSVEIKPQPKDEPKPSISHQNDLLFCQGGSTTLISSSAIGNQWYKDGQLVENESKQNLVVSKSGKYSVIVTNSEGCSITSDSIEVTVNTVPLASINNGLKIAVLDCSKTKVDLKASIGLSYTWYYSKDEGINYIELPNRTDVLSASELGFYKVKVVNANCEATSQPIHVVSVPSVNPAVLETCDGNPIVLESDASGFVNPIFQWNKDGIPIEGAISEKYNATTTGEYSLTVTDQRNNEYTIGTITSCNAKIKINALPQINAGQNFVINCKENSQGKEIGETPENGYIYEWTSNNDISGLSSTTISNPVANPKETTTYTVKKTNLKSLCTSFDSITITVDKEKPIANAGEGFTKNCKINSNVNSIGSTPQTNLIYNWLPVEGLDDASKANPLANPSVSTTYTLVTTDTETGCTSEPQTVHVNVSVIPNPTASMAIISNNCPIESVDLNAIQAVSIDGYQYEWWTGTANSRENKITNTTSYTNAGKVFLWLKSETEECYNSTPFEVEVKNNSCCIEKVGQLVNQMNKTYTSPAFIDSIVHTDFDGSNKVYYILVNNLDGKIKQVNSFKPEFTQIPSGDYTVHAFVFKPNVQVNGIVVGNKLSQIQPQCGLSAQIALSIAPICQTDEVFSEKIEETKMYALLDLSNRKFVAVNSTGIFQTIFTGLSYQIVGFNYTSTPLGLEIGNRIDQVSASNLEIIAGSIVSGCQALITQIEGQVFNDKENKCNWSSSNSKELPLVTMYAKLVNFKNEVIAVSNPIQEPNFYFNFGVQLADGVYTIQLDDNPELTDFSSTYPNGWKGYSKLITIEKGQVLEQFSNTANFIPLCLQFITTKPVLKPTENLIGNTFNYCFGESPKDILIETLPGATLNWYNQLSGGTVLKTAPIVNTNHIGTTKYYVSQTLNAIESERIEIVIHVHDLPQKPSKINGNALVTAKTTQNYSVDEFSESITYKWNLPHDWSGYSSSRSIDVEVGSSDGIISVNAINVYGCESKGDAINVRVVIEDDIEVYNSITPNNDGENDFLRIRNIDLYPDNSVAVYNRWGVEVFNTQGYGQNNNVFKGVSFGRKTFKQEEELPEGTYYYILNYKNSLGTEKNSSGYLFIKR